MPDAVARDNTASLPDELIYYILDELYRPDVFSLAGVSGRFRDLCKQNDLYYFMCRIEIDLDYPACRESVVSAFMTRLDALVADQQPIALKIHISYNDEYLDKGGSPQDIPSFWNAILDAVVAVLANEAKLVQLELDVSVTLMHIFLESCRFPAPWLHTLELSCCFYKIQQLESLVLGPKLFDGIAPRLQYLDLCGPFAWDRDGIIVFRNVKFARFWGLPTNSIPRIGEIVPYVYTLDLDKVNSGPIRDITYRLTDFGPPMTRLEEFSVDLVLDEESVSLDAWQHVIATVAPSVAVLSLLIQTLTPNLRVFKESIANLMAFVSPGAPARVFIRPYGDRWQIIDHAFQFSHLPNHYGDPDRELRLMFFSIYPTGALDGAFDALEDCLRQISGVSIQQRDLPQFRQSVLYTSAALKTVEIELDEGPPGDIGVGTDASHQLTSALSEPAAIDLDKLQINGQDVIVGLNLIQVSQGCLVPPERTLSLRRFAKPYIAISRTRVVELAMQAGFLPSDKAIRLELHDVVLVPD